MSKESLGKRILEKLNRIVEGEDVEKDGQTKVTEYDVTDTNLGPDEKVETSETLKKLRGHLYRFQEASDAVKVGAGGAVAGAVAGSALAKRAAKKAYGLEGVKKGLNKKRAAAGKTAFNSTNKAVADATKANASKALGSKKGVEFFSKRAKANADAANKATKTIKNTTKGLKALEKPIKAAGRAGGWKGAAIGATAGYLGKKSYDYFRNR